MSTIALMEDAVLLKEYVARNSEDAFRELVNRRLDSVYATALRQVRCTHLAEDVCQAVLIALAQKELIKGYLALGGNSAPNGRVFICSADIFIAQPSDVPAPGNNSVRLRISSHQDTRSDYSSYAFNGLTRISGGISLFERYEARFNSGRDQNSDSCRSECLLGIFLAQPQNPIQESGARSLLSFADGHNSYLPVYWNGQPGLQNQPIATNPPSSYQYKWSAN